MVPPASDAGSSFSIISHSNRVSLNQNLCFRETQFRRQRQRLRNGPEGSTTPLQRQPRWNNPAIWALVTENQEISANVGMRGGPGRTRTSNQAVMSRWL